MLEVVKTHKDEIQNGLCELMIGSQSINKVDLHVVSQYKGQIMAFNELLNIKTYLVEAIELDEAYSTGTESPAQD